MSLRYYVVYMIFYLIGSGDVLQRMFVFQDRDGIGVGFHQINDLNFNCLFGEDASDSV